MEITIFYGTCINTKFSNPFVDDGFRFCKLKGDYFDCEYENRWNECPNYTPMRQAIREMK